MVFWYPCILQFLILCFHCSKVRSLPSSSFFYLLTPLFCGFFRKNAWCKSALCCALPFVFLFLFEISHFIKNFLPCILLFLIFLIFCFLFLFPSSTKTCCRWAPTLLIFLFHPQFQCLLQQKRPVSFRTIWRRIVGHFSFLPKVCWLKKNSETLFLH